MSSLETNFAGLLLTFFTVPYITFFWLMSPDESKLKM